MQKRKLLLLNNISRPDYVKDKKRVARGPSSKGCKSGRGSDGQKARQGSKNPKTEGGQFMSYLVKRKRGFNRTSLQYEIIKTSQLISLSNKLGKKSLSVEDVQAYLKVGDKVRYKVLFDERLPSDISVQAHYASKNVKDAGNVNIVLNKDEPSSK